MIQETHCGCHQVTQLTTLQDPDRTKLLKTMALQVLQVRDLALDKLLDLIRLLLLVQEADKQWLETDKPVVLVKETVMPQPQELVLRAMLEAQAQELQMLTKAVMAVQEVQAAQVVTNAQCRSLKL